MGCAQSKVDNEEAVTRCKERRQWMMTAVAARNAFAAAHSAYAVAIKNTGAALSEFGQSEFPDPGPVGAPPPGYTLPPPPPPLPDFSASTLQRSVSMPDLPKKFPPKVQPDASIREDDDEGEGEAQDEEDEDEDSDGDLEHRRRSAGVAMGSLSPSPYPAAPPPPPQQSPEPAQESKAMGTLDYIFFTDDMLGPSLSPTNEVRYGEDALQDRFDTSASAPPGSDHRMVGDDVQQVTPKKVVLETPLPAKVPRKPKQGGSAHHQHVASALALDVKRGKMVPNSRPSISLQKLLTDLDDLFLKASESTHEVSMMLEATRMHYHSNFADSRGHIDHSARVMRAITWNRSFKGVADPDGNRDDFDNDEGETHATVLDKILAWEKKLYDEVKAGELMKIEYKKKVASLNRQKKRGANIESLERTKAAVSHLHTRYIVDMQSMDSTVSEIQRLRDEQLYPKLVELIEGMPRMWEVMHMHHYTQLKIVQGLKDYEVSNTLMEMTEHHYKCTSQLHTIISEQWHSQFNKLISHQREYVEALTNWLKLSLIPIESSLKEKVSSPERPAHAPIQALLQAWHENLRNLPDALAKSAIFSFSEAIGRIVILHQEELKQQQKCKELQKDYLRKNRSFEDWFRKYSEKRMASTVGEPVNEPVNGEIANQTDPVGERRLVVQAAKSRHDEEVESHNRLCKQLREKSLSSLKTHLPELFRNMSDFAEACAKMYDILKKTSEQE